MRTKAVSEANGVLRVEYVRVAEEFEALAEEIEAIQSGCRDGDAT